MSVLIEGMEMPKTCGKCQIKNAIECNRWRLVRSIVLDRHRDCPLIPVPPHGRLGDLDKLADNMRSATAGMEHRAIIMHEIRRAPTIIPADHEEEKMK